MSFVKCSRESVIDHYSILYFLSTVDISPANTLSNSSWLYLTKNEIYDIIYELSLSYLTLKHSQKCLQWSLLEVV